MKNPPPELDIDAIERAIEEAERLHQILGTMDVATPEWAAQLKLAMAQHTYAMNLIRARLELSL